MASEYRILRRHHKPVNKPKPRRSGTDLSLLQKPMELTLTGALQVARCLSSGTPEIKELLTEECDIIFECRVCRNLFRNLPNFIAHKRHYCQKCFLDTKINFVETRQDPETLVVQPQAPNETVPRVVIAEEEYCAAEAVTHRRKPTKILTKIRSRSDFLEALLAKKMQSPAAKKKQSLAAKNVKSSPAKKMGSSPAKRTESPAAKTMENSGNTTNGTPQKGTPGLLVSEGTSDTFKFYTKAAEKVELQEDSRKHCLIQLDNVAGNSNAKRQKVKPDAKVEDVRAAYRKATGPSRSDLAIITESFDRVKDDPIDEEQALDGPRKRNLRQRGGGGEVKTPIAAKLSRRKDCDVKTQTCLKCKATYSSLKTLHFHMMSLHSEKLTIYPCVYSKCKATFTQIWVAVRHLQRAHGCSKGQVEKLKVNLKKYSYTCPVDDVGEIRKTAQGDLSRYRANKRKRADDYHQKVDKVKGEATETIANMTKRLSEKLKKPRDVPIRFGRSGFALYKCQNCNKTFAKPDSFNRHSAFCFGIGALDLMTTSPARSGKLKSAKSDTNQNPVRNGDVEEKDVNKLSTDPTPNGDEVETAVEGSTKPEDITMQVTVQKPLFSVGIEAVTNTIKNGKDMDVTSEIEDKASDSPADLTEGLELSESEPLNDSGEEDNAEKEDDTGKEGEMGKEELEKPVLDFMGRRRPSELDEKSLDKIRDLINEEQLKCLKCSRKYGNISNLHRHALRHLGWKRFRCTLCNFTAYNRSECKTHLSRVHLEKSAGNSSHKFILDLDPEEMRSGVSAKSRVESGRQSSLRLLEKMQLERQMQQSGDKILSLSKRGVSDSSNIPTKKSQRMFDIRQYQQGPMLFTRSGHYPKPVTANHDQVEEAAEKSATTDVSVPITTKVSLPVTTEVSLPITMEVSLPVTTEIEISLPVTTEVSLPVATETSLPATTEVSLPATTAVSLPLTTEVSLPVATEVSLPVTPEISLPVTTEASLPVTAEVSLLATTETSLPATTEVSLPATTAVSLPLTTEVSLPVTTEVSLPLTTEVSLPAATEVSLPVMTEVSLPVTTEVSLLETTETSLRAITETSFPTAIELSLPAMTEESLPEMTEESLPEVSVDVITHVSEDTNDTLSPPALIQQTLFSDDAGEINDALSPPVLTEQMLVSDGATTAQEDDCGGIQEHEVIYVVVDNGLVNMDTTTSIPMTTDASVMQTVDVDTNGQLELGPGEHSIYVVRDEDGNMVSTSDTDLMMNPGLVGFVEEEVVAGECEIMIPELN